MEREYSSIRSELKCKNPLFFMHDDPDGLASFLLLYRQVKKGHGVLVRVNPLVDSRYLRKVTEYSPDKIFVLDVALITQDFVDGARVPVVSIDHHEPLVLNNLLLINPRIKNPESYIPATYVCYVGAGSRQDLWIAMVGCIGDWFFPDFAGEFSKEYPDIMSAEISNADDAMFKSEIGTLVRVFSFALKGSASEAMKCVKILSRVKSPYDVLKQKTPEGRFLYRKFERFNSQYQRLLKSAMSEIKSSGKLCVFTYKNQTSFSSDLANELLYIRPDTFVVVGREKDDEIRMSLRSKHIEVLPRLKSALEGVDGYGGGHLYACGASVKRKDFDKFIERLRNLV